MSDASDEALMDCVCKGDRDAFSVLVHRHIDALYNYALRLCRSPSAAEDLVQDTWLSAWQNADRYRAQKSRLTTWLHRILHNKYIDTTRRRHPDYDQSLVDRAIDDTGYTAAANGNEQRLQSEQMQALLEAHIAELPEHQKAALVLCHLQGFSNAETAHIMGISLRATESLLARARRALRARFKESGHDRDMSTPL